VSGGEDCRVGLVCEGEVLSLVCWIGGADWDVQDHWGVGVGVLGPYG